MLNLVIFKEYRLKYLRMEVTVNCSVVIRMICTPVVYSRPFAVYRGSLLTHPVLAVHIPKRQLTLRLRHKEVLFRHQSFINKFLN